MERIIAVLDGINEKTGKVISWLSWILVLLICLDVFMRYVFDFSLIWVMELEIYLFAFMFLLGAGFTLKHDQHVRVDLFYEKRTEKGKAWIDLIGTVLYLLPWCGIVVWIGGNYALTSFRIGESSPQPGGLPALYILKAAVPVGFFLLGLQAISTILKSIQTIRNHNSKRMTTD